MNYIELDVPSRSHILHSRKNVYPNPTSEGTSLTNMFPFLPSQDMMLFCDSVMHTGSEALVFHSLDVGLFAAGIASCVDHYPIPLIQDHFRGGFQHDVGKSDKDILPLFLSDQPLTEQERVLMDTHPYIGYSLAKRYGIDDKTRLTILYHHKKWDRSGYPIEMSPPEKLPSAAHITPIADSAATAIDIHRTYRIPLTPKQMRDDIIGAMGTQFNPIYQTAFTSWYDDVIQLVHTEDPSYDAFMNAARIVGMNALHI